MVMGPVANGMFKAWTEGKNEINEKDLTFINDFIEKSNKKDEERFFANDNLFSDKAVRFDPMEECYKELNNPMDNSVITIPIHFEEQ